MIEFKCVNSPYSDSFDIYVFNRGQDGRVYAVAESVQFRAIDSNKFTTEPVQPAFKITGLDVCQNTFAPLMESLWAMGVRPAEMRNVGSGHDMKNHLEDMRKIAFNSLKLKI